MPSREKTKRTHQAAVETPEVRFAANAVRLSALEWFVAVLLIVCACGSIPRWWQIVESPSIGSDYRIPFSLGNDYWNYANVPPGVQIRRNLNGR